MKSRLRYIFTWISLGVLIICSTILVAVSWNSQVSHRVSSILMLLLWVGISASGIYLFLLAVKKAHRQWIDEERHLKSLEQEAIEAKERRDRRSGPSREHKALDFATAARKLLRRIPEQTPPEKLGAMLLKSLARDLEIMSGVYYLEEQGEFKTISTYAMTSSTEPHAFKPGEGLPGQVARNQQILVLTRFPEGHLEVYSGLGKAAPSYLAIVPLVRQGKTVAIIECSGYRYEAGEIENMFRILARDLMDKLSPNFS